MHISGVHSWTKRCHMYYLLYFIYASSIKKNLSETLNDEYTLYTEEEEEEEASSRFASHSSVLLHKLRDVYFFLFLSTN
jgi:hypothetical protein